MTTQLKILRVDKDLPLPTYAYPGDAGLDLYSTIDISLEPFQRALIPTGIKLAIPDGYAGFVQPRSGLALRAGLSQANTPGLIDSHYRGEVQIVAVNLDGRVPIQIKRGDRIAQLVILAVPELMITEVSELEDTQRGQSGFGSSGVQ